MKKTCAEKSVIKIEKKLNLNRQLVAKLNSEELSNIDGGGIWSIGARCTQHAGDCESGRITRGWACNDGVDVYDTGNF